MLSEDSTHTSAHTRHRHGWPDRAELPTATAADGTPCAARSAVAGLGGDAADDWDTMLNAVTERLQAIVQSTTPGSEHPPQHDLPGRAHALALECGAALRQLQIEMALDRAERRRLECELADARAELARARLDFEDSQAGELHARHLSLHDELTALPNRRHCLERLDHALALAAARRTTAALLYLDLDGFKVVNDRHGHEMGDEVLRIVAARLSRAVRAGDIVCRLGGDEFVCLPADALTGPQLAHLATKLMDAVAAPLTVNGLRFQVRASIGVAIFPAHAGDTEALLKTADAAMYRAKQQRSGFAFGNDPVEIELPLD